MYSLRIIYDVDGWAWHHQAECLRRYAADDFSVSTAAVSHYDSAADLLGHEPPDVVLSFGSGGAGRIRDEIERRKWPTKLVVRWTTGWPFHFSRLENARATADLIIFNNAEYWQRAGQLPRTAYLANGVDLTTFTVARPMEEREARVLWCGSTHQHAIKGYKDLLVPLRDALAKLSIDCDLFLVDSYGENKLSPAGMVSWYNSGTVFVCASRVEGTPNVALEAAASGCAIVTTAVGNMPELIKNGHNGFLVEPNVEALLDGVTRAVAEHQRLSHAMQSDIRRWDWKTRAPEFFDLFRDLVSTTRCDEAAPWARTDISDELTVFLEVVDSAEVESPLRHLQDQGCGFRIELIDTHGMDVVRDCHARCQTPYFAIVPSNALLNRDAISWLFENICTSDPRVSNFSAPLVDIGGETNRRGISIFRRASIADDDKSFCGEAITAAALTPYGNGTAHSRAVGRRIAGAPTKNGKRYCVSSQRTDLRNEVTVFISTVGASTFADSVKHILDQDCYSKVEIIDRVAPLSVALQAVLDRCKTPYFVQVDEDMLLRPHCVRHLYEMVRRSDPKVAMYVGRLYDVHLQRHIHGVKILKHAIVSRYPYFSMDYAPFGQLTKDGFVIQRGPLDGATLDAPATLGLHGTAWTPRSIYERYRTLHRWVRQNGPPIEWLENCPAILMDKFLASPSPLNYCALIGMIGGVLSRQDRVGAEGMLPSSDESRARGFFEREGREKDFRTYHDLPGLAAAEHFFQQAASGIEQTAVGDFDSVIGLDLPKQTWTADAGTPRSCNDVLTCTAKKPD